MTNIYVSELKSFLCCNDFTFFIPANLFETLIFKRQTEETLRVQPFNHGT